MELKAWMANGEKNLTTVNGKIVQKKKRPETDTGQSCEMFL